MPNLKNNLKVRADAPALLRVEPYFESYFIRFNTKHRHFADPEYGEWYGYLHRDGRVSTSLKGNLWKSFFHHPRMQWTCWQLLEDDLKTPTKRGSP